MKKYAKIVDNNSKKVDVGLGTDTEFYRSIGMEEMNVEQAYNGEWYLSGYAPAKPESVVLAERVKELKNLLDESDYKAIKHSEGLITDEEYEPIKAQRQAWRDEINELEN